MVRKIRIGIVEDDENMRDIIYQYIEQAVEEPEIVEIHCFSDAETFLEKVTAGHGFHILFTDIQLANMNGMELGKEIKKIQTELYIVFITSFSEYAAESYVIEAYQYILKQDMEQRLPRVTRQLVEKVKRQGKQYRMIGTSLNKKKVHYRDIIYIHKVKGAKYISFVTTDGEVRERIALEKLYQELESKEFVLVERSYIVNMKHICKISGETIYLERDNQVKISRTSMQEVKRAINQYWREL